MTHDEGTIEQPEPGPASPPAARAWVAPEAAPVQDLPRLGTTDATTAPDDLPAEVGGDLPVPLGPMTFSAMVDGGYSIIKRRPKAVLGAAALFVVPVQVLAVFLQRDALDNNATFAVFTGVSESTGSDDGTVFLGVIVAALLHSFLTMLLGAVIAVFVGGWYAGGEPTWRDAVMGTLRKSGVLFVAWLVLLPAKVASLSLICLVAAPPFAVSAFFVVTAPAIILEGLGPFAAIKRSATLTVRRYWRCLWLVVLSYIVQTFVQLAFRGVPDVLGLLLPSPFNWIVVAAGQSIAALITTTALVGASVLLYLDLRVRTEGLDLELQASRVMAEAPA